jgi:photosystem II stability/assembly factor-like uncharacterized protein
LKKVLLPILSALLIFSCKKNHDANTRTSKEDSLGTGWTKITGVVEGYITDIYFSGNTGFLATNSFNEIFKSTNGGDTWQKVYQSSAPFLNMGMGSSDNAGFVWGNPNKTQILYTTNGGASFDSAELGTNNNNFNDIFYVSPQIAYANNGKLWKTVNGGKNWTTIYTFPGSGLSMSVLFFLNEQNGWAVAKDVLYKTTNSGVSWTPITNHGIASSGGENSLFFTDLNTGYYGNGTTIKKTVDGGANWLTVYTAFDQGYFHNLHFINSQLGYLTDKNLIMKTTDGGATWTREVRLGDNYAIELHFTDANHGWAGTNGGTILKFVK